MASLINVPRAALRRGSRKVAVVAVLALVGTLTACGSDDGNGGSGSGSGSDKLFVATGGPTANQMLPYLADVLGYAKEEGLDLEVKSLEANVVSAVVAGRADMGLFGAGAALAPVGQGKDTQLVFGVQAGRATAFLTAPKSVKSIADCKRTATNPIGSSAYASTAAYKRATNSNYEIVEFTTPSDVAASVLSGQTNCAISSLGVLNPGVAQGLKVLIDPREESQIPPNSVQGAIGVSLWGMKDALADKKDAVVKFFKALIKVQKYLQTATPDEVAAALMKHSDFEAADAKALASNVTVETPFFFPNDGEILASDWPATQTYYKAGNPAIDPSKEIWSYGSRVDMSYLDAANGS